MTASGSDTLTQLTAALLATMLEARLEPPAARFLAAAHIEVTAGTTPEYFVKLFSMCSRYTLSRIKLAPSQVEITRAASLLNGWNPERWSLLEAMRVSLLLAWPDQCAAGSFDKLFEYCFQFADEGELCALYRSLPLLCENTAHPKRFVERAREGCRSNMLSIFEAVACDSHYPFLHFDTIAWNQLVMKAIFMNVPLWRIQGLDNRLSSTLSQMVLDFIAERRSAGREVPAQLWACFGEHVNENALAVMRDELAAATDNRSAKALIFALARAGKLELAQPLGNQNNNELTRALKQATEREVDQYAFADL